MKFDFKNLGYIDEGTVELSDLTVISGPNNSGKTYATYSIYGLLKSLKSSISFSMSKKQMSQLVTKGSVSIDLEKLITESDTLLNKASKEFSQKLDDYFSASEDLFERASIELSIKNIGVNLDKEFKSVARFGETETLIIDKAPKDKALNIVLETSDGETKVPNRIMNDIVGSAISECLFSESIPSPFVVTSERTGISLFYKELDISKNKIVEHLTEQDNLDFFSLLDSMRSRYAKPIQDNINIIRDYDEINKRKSFIKSEKDFKYVLDSLRDLIGGSFKFVGKQVIYEPKKEYKRDKIGIPVYVASSSIKSLFLIDLYINSLAKKNGVLIIDEPELNLHPDNQRKMAGLLSRMVNAGIKVVITTHSDYLIRELNNRIMLSNDFEEKQDILKSQNSPKMVKQDILKPEQVRAYTMKEHRIAEVEVDKYGIKMDIFDEIIKSSNQLSDEIYFSLESYDD